MLLNWSKVLSETNHYFYSVFLYKDQNDNLLSTVHLEYFRYNDPYMLNMDFNQVLHNNYFHSYTVEDHNNIYNLILPLNETMAFKIGKK